MHDPMTVAFDVKRPWPQRTRPHSTQRHIYGRFYWPTWATIWHVDPERDGTDDSCGWFKRARHGDPAVLKKIEGEFEFMWDRDRCCWFNAETGLPQCSTLGITLEMFRRAARAFYDGRAFDQHGWRGSYRFMRKNLPEILAFAENPLDSMRTFIEQLYGPSEKSREERIHEAASIIYGCLMRWAQPWYRHPRWHVWHWKIQVHSLQAFKRWAFSRCSGCGFGFSWGYCPYSGGWGGDGPRWFRSESGVFHNECFPKGPSHV